MESYKVCAQSFAATGRSTAIKCGKHTDFYFADGNVVLEVEGMLYRLHRSLLEKHSPIFREMFMMPQPEGSVEGLSDDHPIILSGINGMNFTRLLWLLYPPILASCKVTTVDEWMSIFDQADRWQIEELREYALNQLRASYIKPVDKVLFWSRYSLPYDEVIPAYMDIISRSESLSLPDAQKFGLEMVVKVAKARDIAHSKGVCYCSNTGGFSVRRDMVLKDIVREVFFSTTSPSPRA